MLDQIDLNQLHITPMHDLSPLLTHPDFHQGVTDAQAQFLGEYAPAPLTLDEMILEVEIDASRRLVEEHPEYNERDFLYWLGYAYGIINEGFTYDSQLEQYSPVEQYTPVGRPCGPLPALLNDSHFLQGVRNAQHCFLECYAPAPLTLDEMVEEVEQNVGRGYQTSKQHWADLAEMPPYISYLGFVFGTINEGLTYTTPSAQYEAPSSAFRSCGPDGWPLDM